MSSFGVAMPRLLIFHHFKHTCTTKAFEHFGRIVLVARLRQRQSEAKKPPNVGRQGHQVFVAAPYPFKRFLVCGHGWYVYELV